MAVTSGNKINTTDISSLISSINITLAKYGVANIANFGISGNKVAASDIEKVKAQLALANNSTKCKTKVDLSKISAIANSRILAQTINDIEGSNLVISNSFCSCDNCCSCDDCCSCDNCCNCCSDSW